MNKKKIVILLTIILTVQLAIGCGEGETVMPAEDDLVLVQEETAEEAASALPVEEEAADEADEQEETGSKEQAVKSLFVHICGAVMSPGVYELTEGSRVYEAVEAAGGFAPEACQDYVNLAMFVTDGEKLAVPTQEEVDSALAAGTPIPGEVKLPGETVQQEQQQTLVNINTASVQELCTLTGIGESRAEAIIAYREGNGGFASIEDIMKVTGIKQAMFDKIKDQIKV